MNLEILAQPIPATAVVQRSQSGMTLSYLEGWYVISKLNEAFGATGWSKHVQDVRVVQEAEQDGKWRVGYVARVHLQAGDKSSEDVGFGQGIDKDLGRAHESAAKEAVTDALKRCAKDLGWATGLALYDKSQSHVVESLDPKERAKSWVATLPEKDAVVAYIKEWAKLHGGPHYMYAAECADAGFRSLAEVKGYFEDGRVNSDVERAVRG